MCELGTTEEMKCRMVIYCLRTPLQIFYHGNHNNALHRTRAHKNKGYTWSKCRACVIGVIVLLTLRSASNIIPILSPHQF